MSDLEQVAARVNGAHVRGTGCTFDADEIDVLSRMIFRLRHLSAALAQFDQWQPVTIPGLNDEYLNARQVRAYAADVLGRESR